MAEDITVTVLNVLVDEVQEGGPSALHVVAEVGQDRFHPQPGQDFLAGISTVAAPGIGGRVLYQVRTYRIEVNV